MSRDLRLHRIPADVLDYEIVQEQAVALGRMGRALEAVLAGWPSSMLPIRVRARRHRCGSCDVLW